MQSSPGKSCDDIYQINKATRGVSGDYWIQTSTGVHQVYCDMELECGGHKGGWMRVANFSSSSGDDCPTGWTKITTPTDPVYPSTDVCRSPNDASGCYPAMFPTFGVNYFKVCGMARGYQKGSPDAFHGLSKSLNGAYVDGLSITVGTPRQHIWTYVIGNNDGDAVPNCPCAGNQGNPAYPFIRNDYYCESGTTGGVLCNINYTNDPLWDGEGCVDTNNNCCASPGMPWFVRQFAVVLNNDIEASICTDQPYGDEGVLVDELKLYIQ